jgi:hypothetical protein
VPNLLIGEWIIRAGGFRAGNSVRAWLGWVFNLFIAEWIIRAGGFRAGNSVRAWLGWVFNLLMAEWVIRARKESESEDVKLYFVLI